MQPPDHPGDVFDTLVGIRMPLCLEPRLQQFVPLRINDTNSCIPPPDVNPDHNIIIASESGLVFLVKGHTATRLVLKKLLMLSVAAPSSADFPGREVGRIFV